MSLLKPIQFSYESWKPLQILWLLSMHANYFKMIQLLMHMSILYDFEEE